MSDRMVIYDERTGKMLSINEEAMKKRINALNNELFEKCHGVTLDEWLSMLPKPKVKTLAVSGQAIIKCKSQPSQPSCDFDLEIHTRTINGETQMFYEFKPLTK